MLTRKGDAEAADDVTSAAAAATASRHATPLKGMSRRWRRLPPLAAEKGLQTADSCRCRSAVAGRGVDVSASWPSLPALAAGCRAAGDCQLQGSCCRPFRRREPAGMFRDAAAAIRTATALITGY